MAGLRTVAQRQADVRSILAKNGDAWLATASSDGKPQLVAVSCWWDGEAATIATRGNTVTARNLGQTRVGRLGIGTPDDVIMVDVTVSERRAVAEAPPEFRARFASAVGWDPADEGDDWAFFRLQPVRIQAYRGYGELQGRQVMSDGRWLA